THRGRGAPARPADAEPALSAPFLLLISIDGFADFYWRDAQVKAPTLRALAERGAVADGVTAVFPSTTWPTHVSLVTGVRPDRHGVVANHVLNRATRRAEDLRRPDLRFRRTPEGADRLRLRGRGGTPGRRRGLAGHAPLVIDRLQPAVLQGPARVRDP